MTKNNWRLNDLDQALISLALEEDLGVAYKDATTQTLFGEINNKRRVKLISKENTPIVFSGLPIIRAVLDAFQKPYTIETTLKDGDTIGPDSPILHIESDAQTLLMTERVILNFVRHLCAIATLTRQFVDLVQDTSLKILDTRKTTPGWRHLEKYAVLCGGGGNHRMGLYDAIMIKDNHIDLIGSVENALKKIPEKKHESLPVIFEVRDKNELQQVIAFGKDKVDRVLLDNMSPALMAECVALCKNHFLTEASGNINLSTIVNVAKSGVDFASVGMITHSAGNIDLSMKAAD